MDIVDFFVTNLLPKIQNIGVWGYWVVLLISLSESVAFIGIFFPGATIIAIVGFLSSQGYLDIGDLIWFVAIGAILGDSLSYYLGTKGTGYFPREKDLLKKSHFDRAEEFFHKHGGKSVFIGRFVGPMRAIIPFVAGFSKMKYGKFLLWDVSSAFLWAAVTLLLGYFFGGILDEIRVWSKWVGIVGGAVVISIVAYMLARKGEKEIEKM